MLFILFHAIQRGLGNIYLACFDQLWHIAIEESQKQCSDMGTVYVGIGHDNDLMITEFFHIKIFGNPCTKGCDHISDFFRIQDSVQSCLFYIQNFTAQRQDRLCFGVSGLDGRTAGGIPFDDVDFTFIRIAAGAVRQFTGHSCIFQTCLSANQFPCLSRRVSGSGSHHTLFDDCFTDGRIFL